MPSRIGSALAAGLAAAGLLAGPALGHGAVADVGTIEAVAVDARYDTGEPMRDAQVSVFAPDDPTRPWLVGRTDAAGRFVFAPDDRAGRWAVQVRQAGHGTMSYVEVGPAGAVVVSAPAGSGIGPLQRALMVACVAWGCVGTALWFRPQRRAKPS